MKNRAGSIANPGVPQVSIAVDVYFPRAHLIESLAALPTDFPAAGINLRMTTMQVGERQWLPDDLGAKHDFLRAGLGWGHMPAHLVRDDVANGRLVEFERHAWHIGSLRFMVSRRRGHDACACEMRLVELLGSQEQRGFDDGGPFPAHSPSKITTAQA